MKLRKVENFQQATLRLEEGIAEYIDHPSSTMRDGVIQRFEFTFELAWKSLKEFLQDQGVSSELSFPKQVLKEAYTANIIHQQDVWVDMLSARNITSHIYDDNQASAVMSNITSRYIAQLKQLSKYYQQN